MRRSSRLAVLALAGSAALVVASAAFAHAIVSPPVAEAKVLQQFTLSVPTEKAGLTTTRVELTVPSGFAIDSFEPPPAPWRQQVESTGSGDNAVVQKVTWTGGNTPTGSDAVFRFNASATSSTAYVFDVRQTYSDGSVVDWSGPESSDTPAPRVDALSSFASGGTSILSIVALVVGAVGILIGLVALLGRRGGASPRELA